MNTVTAETLSSFVAISASYLLPGPRSFIVDLFLCSREGVPQLFLSAHHRLPQEQLAQLQGLESLGMKVMVRQADLYRLSLELGLDNSVLCQGPKATRAQVHHQELSEYFDFAKELLQQYSGAGSTTGHSATQHFQQVSMTHLLKKAFLQDQYLELLRRVQEELWCFPPNKSQYISNVRALAELLDQDTHSARVAALSFLMAKELGGIKEIEALADLFVAGLLKDVGLLFLQHQWICDITPALKKEQEKEYWQHPLLSTFYLSKTGIQLSTGALQLISEHHESALGTGKPQGLSTHQQHPLSRYLQVVEALLKYIKVIQFKQQKGGKPPSSSKEILEKLLDGKMPEQLASFDSSWVQSAVRFFINT